MSNDKNQPTCPRCGAEVSKLVKAGGQMMCSACAAERERAMKQVATAMQKGR